MLDMLIKEKCQSDELFSDEKESQNVNISKSLL